MLTTSHTTLRRISGANHPLGWALDFHLPTELEAAAPPEARGLSRDEVRLMVSYQATNRVTHTQFRNIEQFLEAGDVLVINTSGTLNAALEARRADNSLFELHLSTHLPADLWIVEMRLPTNKPFYDVKANETFQLPGGGKATLHVPYNRDQTHARLWIASLELPQPLHAYLEIYGFPIRYSYVKQSWPSQYYQTVYATEMGSAEMPSAGRAFTCDLITRLVARGIQIAPLILHTGVASLEEHEPPYEEYYKVEVQTARIVNDARLRGKRVIAVGTTAIRALETVTDQESVTHAGEGWTRLIITPQRGLKSVNGLLTGLHEPRATHLAMIEALASLDHLEVTYAQALQNGYLWHEFGDLHLILP